LRIFFIRPYFYPAWGYCGLPLVANIICKELVKKSHEVAVYTPDEGSDCPKTGTRVKKADGVAVVRENDTMLISKGCERAREK